MVILLTGGNKSKNGYNALLARVLVGIRCKSTALADLVGAQQNILFNNLDLFYFAHLVHNLQYRPESDELIAPFIQRFLSH